MHKENRWHLPWVENYRESTMMNTEQLLVSGQKPPPAQRPKGDEQRLAGKGG